MATLRIMNSRIASTRNLNSYWSRATHAHSVATDVNGLKSDERGTGNCHRFRLRVGEFSPANVRGAIIRPNLFDCRITTIGVNDF